MPLTLRLTVGTGGGGLINFSRTANRTWRRGNPGAWQVIGWEPGGCAQAQQSSSKVTCTNNDLLQPGIPLLSRGAKEYHLHRNEFWAQLWETRATRPPKSVFLAMARASDAVFPSGFSQSNENWGKERKTNKQHQPQHTYTCSSTRVCSHACVFPHTRTHGRARAHKCHARPLALTCMNIKAVHLASCPPPCLVRFLWLTPPVSQSHSQSPVVHPNFHGVSQD